MQQQFIPTIEQASKQSKCQSFDVNDHAQNNKSRADTEGIGTKIKEKEQLTGDKPEENKPIRESEQMVISQQLAADIRMRCPNPGPSHSESKGPKPVDNKPRSESEQQAITTP